MAAKERTCRGQLMTSLSMDVVTLEVPGLRKPYEVPRNLLEIFRVKDEGMSEGLVLVVDDDTDRARCLEPLPRSWWIQAGFRGASAHDRSHRLPPRLPTHQPRPGPTQSQSPPTQARTHGSNR